MILNLIVYIISLIVYLLLVICAILFVSKIWAELKLKMCTCTVKLDGKVVIVTGANTGIGLETAKRFAKHGARVIIASRNLEKSKAAAKEIKNVTGNPDVTAKTLDLSRLSSIKEFVEDFNKTYDRLDILVNNAGMGKMEQEFTEDGIEVTMQVNHVGPVYLTHLLLDKLVASKPSRIVFVASGLHIIHRFNPDDIIGKNPANAFIRYANSKICNIMSAKALAQRLPAGVTVNSVHPGTTDSEIWNIPIEFLKKLTYFILSLTCQTAEECAQTTVHVAMAPSLANVSGQYFDSCKPAGLWRSVTVEDSLRLWDETIKIAEDALKHNKKE